MNIKEYQEWLYVQIEYCRIEVVRWTEREQPSVKLFYEGKREALEMALYQTNELRGVD